jgi:deferrochelatase/peroxidase EfeB
VSPAIGRRGFLAGALGAGVAAPLLATAAHRAAIDAGRARTHAFHGAHQPGILTPAQRSSAFVAFDVTATSRAELRSLLRTITRHTAALMADGIADDLGLAAPPADNGVLGPGEPADGLTVTTSLGASLFDDRFGLADAKPARLRRMEDFANDRLRREVCDGDLLLQICAENTDAVVHALRDLTKATRGAMQVRWRMDGFVSPPRPSGAPRNLMGFKDGSANLKTADARAMSELVWTRAGGAEPAWVEGGSYHVVRLIRMLVEFWDRVNLQEQENMIGRRRDSGAPQTGTHEHDIPDYVNDPTGDVIQIDAHIRRANPRTPEVARQQMLRRPYNYDAGTDVNGNLDQGLIFVCYQQDLERQFVTVQKRLADEPLVDYISPFGGGYFFALPGVRDDADWLGRGLFDAVST